MLGDVDKQQSARSWLKRRDASLPHIVSWAVDQRNVLKVPAGVSHVVLDTPGGMQGLDLARIVMSADAIVMPVCNSLFDRESAASCYSELIALPRLVSGRCKIGMVGMRLAADSQADESLSNWAKQLQIPYLGGLRESPLYVKNLDLGQTMFDLSGKGHLMDLFQWEAILEWLRPLAYSAGTRAETQSNNTNNSGEHIPAYCLPSSVGSVMRSTTTSIATVARPAEPNSLGAQRVAVRSPSSNVSVARVIRTEIRTEKTSALAAAGRLAVAVPQFLLRQVSALG